MSFFKKSLKPLLDKDYSKKSDVKDNLTSTDTDKPLSAKQGKELKTLVDGKASSSHTHSNATTSTAGLMSSDDKTKLDGIVTNANKYTHPSYTARTGKPTANQTPAFGETATVSQIKSDSSGHVTEANDFTIKIPNTTATTSAAGLMSSDDKTKLNGVATGANKTTIANNLTTTTAGSALDATQGKALNTAINQKTVTVEKLSEPETGFTATYVVKQNGSQVGASINIPKDFLVKSASLKTCTTANTPLNGLAVNDPYLDFVVNTVGNDATDNHIYINVKDLVDTYTAGTGITLSNNAFSVNYEGTKTNIKMNGTQAVGSLNTAARGDHVHPTDTSRAPTAHAVNATTYGLSTSGVYGHAKVIENLTTDAGNGLALGAGQGKALKAQIDSIISGETPTDHNHDGSYIKTGTGTVTSTNIADGTIVNGDIANTTITGGKLVNGTITATQLASNAVETAKIKDGAVTNAKLSGTRITASSSNIVDLNAYTSKGIYYCDQDPQAPYIIHCPWSNGTATPYTGNKGFFLLVEDWGTNTYSCKQTLTYYSGNNTYVRTKTNSTTWSNWKEFNTNNNDYLRLATRIISGESAQIPANSIIGGVTDSNNVGKYYIVASGMVLDMRYPLLYNTSAINSGSYTDNVYQAHTGVNLQNTVSGKTVTSQKQVYIEGTAYSNNKLTVSNNVFVSDDNLTNGNYYVYIGVSYDTKQIRFDTFNQIVYKKTTNGLVPVGLSYNDLTDKPSTFTPSSHNHGSLANGGTLNSDITSVNKVAVTDSSNNLKTISKLPDTSISWDGDALSNQISPLDMAMGEDFSANRLAYLSGNNITVEYSTDGGSTWTETGTATEKTSLVTLTNDFIAGNNSTVDYSKNQVRVTIKAGNNNANSTIYMYTRKILLYVSTAGASGTKVQVSTANYETPTTFTNRGSAHNISGWSGWNSIPLALTYGGYNNGLTGHVQSIRFTFTQTGGTGNFRIKGIRLYGETAWGSPSNLSRTGHMYTYDVNQNVTFPAKIIKSGGTNTQLLLANGDTKATTDFATSGHTHTKSQITDFPTSMTPTAHQADTNAYGAATTAKWGHTKLNSATNSTDETTAATPKAVKAAYDLANGKPSLGTTSTTAAKGDHNHDGTYLKSYTPPTASTSQAGIVQLNSATNSTSTTQAATPSAVKSAYDLANGKSTVSFTQTKTSGVEIGKITINGTSTSLYQQDNNTTYTAASATPAIDSITGTVGTSAKYAREDHAHPFIDFTCGENNTAGYITLLQIKINANYQDTPIKIEIYQRNRIESITCHVRFTNINSTDPTLNSITHTGKDTTLYLYKSATSTWQLILKKGENVDSVRTKVYNVNDGIAVTKIGTQLATLPTGTTNNPIHTSTNITFTSDEKTKLAGIATNANNYSHPSTHAASMITGLATVATSGSYADLSNKPSYTATVTSSTTGAYKIGSINISGSNVDIYGKDTNTTYTIPTGSSTATDIKMNGTQSAGSSSNFAKADHVHPVDTSRVAVSQGTGNSGKFLKVNSSGNVACESVTSMTPTSHTHGDLQNNGQVGSTAVYEGIVLTDTNGKIKASYTLPTAKITVGTSSNAHKVLVTDADGKLILEGKNGHTHNVWYDVTVTGTYSATILQFKYNSQLSLAELYYQQTFGGQINAGTTLDLASFNTTNFPIAPPHNATSSCSLGGCVLRVGTSGSIQMYAGTTIAKNSTIWGSIMWHY